MGTKGELKPLNKKTTGNSQMTIHTCTPSISTATLVTCYVFHEIRWAGRAWWRHNNIILGAITLQAAFGMWCMRFNAWTKLCATILPLLVDWLHSNRNSNSFVVPLPLLSEVMWKSLTLQYIILPQCISSSPWGQSIFPSQTWTHFMQEYRISNILDVSFLHR